jgi:hypothetical protein
MPVAKSPYYVKGVSTALSTAVSVIPLERASEQLSSAFPQSGTLSKLMVVLTSIAGAATVTWYLSADAAGDVPITPSHAATITTGQTAGKGGITVLIDAGYVIPATLYVTGKVYLVAVLDAGTAAGVPYLEFFS